MASTADTGLTISNVPPASPAMDFSFLREQGINYVQAMSSDLWTDFNIHDPGVTILEVLAYAITDISTRANKPVQDLLASKPGVAPGEKDFFSAAEILGSSPITLNDFRKILIDRDKIRNAWLSVSDTSEQTVYFDPDTDALSYTTGQEIVLGGLYTVLLEFEEDQLLGDLNSSLIQAPIGIGGSIEAAYPYWDEVPAAWTGDITFNSITLEDVTGVPGEKLRPLDDVNGHDYFAILDVTYNVTTTDRIPVTVKVTDGIDAPTIQAKLVETGADSLTKTYNKKVAAANQIVVAVKQFLYLNRNLCEDYYAFKATRVQEIAVTTTLKIAAGINVEKTLAEIFHRLDNFFSPAIPFHTLDEMLAKPGFTPDRVFEGPLLQHGFIDDEDLQELRRSNVIYTSDLVRIILALNEDFNYGNSAFVNQTKGIIAVEDLTITNYINNQPISVNVRNCLSLASVDLYKAKLSIDKSNITVLKDTDVVAYDINVVKALFKALKTPAKPAILPTVMDLEVPTGLQLPVEEYYSIQNDFPLNYGIGRAGFPSSASAERQAQARQLKGFLLFFEQLLADYLAQLAHIKDLFSLSTGVNTTYFSQPLDEVPDVAPLLGPGYASALPDLLKKYESSATAINRRNNFLDHLLARFGEDFTDLALLMYAKYGNAATDILIKDKFNFLKSYDQTGYSRARSFNYADPAPWGTDNVPWVKRRICGLLGIDIFRDQDIAGTLNEGFHMIEHILLRPKINDAMAGNVDAFLAPPADSGGITTAGGKDPYSFRVTYIFPNWPERFADPNFSKYIEKIIQRETPAHVLAKVYWVDDATMASFEAALKAWLVANGTPANETVLTAAKNQLIDVINNLSV